MHLVDLLLPGSDIPLLLRVLAMLICPDPDQCPKADAYSSAVLHEALAAENGNEA
uniref:hypothetical protein n=1 Tax=Pseudoclavibacter sp. RFBI5 TaxID=2080578 RepID=UPI0015E32370|nr:hypothetical protein [Pseudoclavibacter sp. RFBI5]